MDQRVTTLSSTSGWAAEPTMRPPQSSPSSDLHLVSILFERLNDAEIPYCHWKSNEHLGAAAAGLTDLDVLVDRRHGLALERIFSESGFKRFAAPPLRAYPGIEDYIGLDRDTGRLAHLHLHYELTLGERHLKSYRLPWENEILQTRRLDPDSGIYTSDPTIELLLLLVRAALKTRARDRMRNALGMKTSDTADFEREFKWLRARIDETKLRETAVRLLGPQVDQPLRALLASPLAGNSRAAFAAALRSNLKWARTYGRIEALLSAWTRELEWYADAINRRYLHRPTPLRRVSPRGGTVVVLLGSDGSGKSTLSQTLRRWLGWKLDVMPIYFGSGNGAAAFYRIPLRLAQPFLRPILGGAVSARPSPPDDRATSLPVATIRRDSALSAIARAVWALALSLEKRGKLRRMIKARNRGMVVICDRFPQTHFPGFNDGPLLAQWHDHRWRSCRAMAAWEATPYAAADQMSPELVIKLTTTPEVALQRRPEMNLRELQRRVKAVREFRFSPVTKVVELDAGESLETIALAAKRHVWDAL